MRASSLKFIPISYVEFVLSYSDFLINFTHELPAPLCKNQKNRQPHPSL